MKLKIQTALLCVLLAGSLAPTAGASTWMTCGGKKAKWPEFKPGYGYSTIKFYAHLSSFSLNSSYSSALITVKKSL